MVCSAHESKRSETGELPHGECCPSFAHSTNRDKWQDGRKSGFEVMTNPIGTRLEPGANEKSSKSDLCPGMTISRESFARNGQTASKVWLPPPTNDQFIGMLMTPNAEQQRLNETKSGQQDWRRWEPYLSERQWGTVRE